MSDRKKHKAGARKRSLEDLLSELPPPTWEEIQEWRKLLRRMANVGATQQILSAIPPGDSKAFQSARSDSDFAFATIFVPGDGVESALSRLIVAATNGAMECFIRAPALDVPGRLIELNLGTKLTLTVATLTKALDDHRLRAKELPIFVDDTVRPTRAGGLRKPNSGGGNSAESSEGGAASDEAPKHSET